MGIKCNVDWKYFSQIATYGKSFVKASQDAWELFEKREMETIVDSDMTSAICFLTGVCSGSICVIVVAAWTATVYPNFIATLSLLSAYIGYLLVSPFLLLGKKLFSLLHCDRLKNETVKIKSTLYCFILVQLTCIYLFGARRGLPWLCLTLV